MDEQQPAPPASPASPVSPHVRLKELQAIPDKLRTDEQWDELNDLEIKLASVNRQGAPMPNAQRPGQGGGPGPRNDQRRGGGGGGGRNNEQRKKFHGRRPRPV
jgi:hypothetical protein